MRLFLLFVCSMWAFIPSFVFAQLSEIALPVLDIETVNHVMPTRTVVHAPEGCIGTTIADNNYVPGKMVLSLKGQTVYDTGEYEKGYSGMRIKIRGNSTGASEEQHPYKIKLSKKFDLLGRDDTGFKHKDWLLLRMRVWNNTFVYEESEILYIVGAIVSKILDKEWTPEYGLVNVVLNGEYQGMYYLMEAVSKGDKRIPLANTGFLVEHDTFWWNEDVYFKTDYQVYACGYTYKYPDSDDVTEEIQTEIKDYISTAEHAIYNGEDVSQYIDITSFAKWMLIHDFLGTEDLAGANRFMYRMDNNSLLCMGPAWDHDSSFKCKGWSNIHSSRWFYYPVLFQREDFVTEYVRLWKNVRPTILSDIRLEFDKVEKKYGDVFDESIAIHQTRWPGEGRRSLHLQINDVIDKLYERVKVIDDLMQQYDKMTDGIEELYGNREEISGYADLFGRRYQNNQKLNKGIYIYNGSKHIVD